MSDFKDHTDTEDDWLNFDFSDGLLKNERIAVRYVREDIAASVCKIRLFNFGFLINKEILVELIDISSKGVLISTNKKLSIKKKITLTLKFEDAKTFQIKACVVRKVPVLEYQYGIKFDRLNDELGDYLLETQRKLIFK
jgi:hypothetical protein